jgi:uncharacterized membrane protein (UPF0127 family)
MPDKNRLDLDAPPDPGPLTLGDQLRQAHDRYADPLWAKILAPYYDVSRALSPPESMTHPEYKPGAYAPGERESANVVSDQDIPVRSLWQHGGPVAGPKRAHLVLHSTTGPHIISAVVAATQMEQHQGLMGVRHLGDHEGMLFPHHPPQVVSMVMAHTLIPLDMIFVRPDGIVSKIVTGRPLSLAPISSGAPVSACLEVAGGLAHRIGLKVGDKVSLS